MKENSLIELDPWLPTKRNFLVGSSASNSGCVPALTVDVVKAVSAPVVPSILNCETFDDPKLATYR